MTRAGRAWAKLNTPMSRPFAMAFAVAVCLFAPAVLAACLGLDGRDWFAEWSGLWLYIQTVMWPLYVFVTILTLRSLSKQTELQRISGERALRIAEIEAGAFLVIEMGTRGLGGPQSDTRIGATDPSRRPLNQIKESIVGGWRSVSEAAGKVAKAAIADSASLIWVEIRNEGRLSAKNIRLKIGVDFTLHDQVSEKTGEQHVRRNIDIEISSALAGGRSTQIELFSLAKLVEGNVSAIAIWQNIGDDADTEPRESDCVDRELIGWMSVPTDPFTAVAD